jgi:hypothetical protein
MAQPGRWHWNRLSFNGAVDVFTVNAMGTPISTPVPAGAMIGRVQVTNTRRHTPEQPRLSGRWGSSQPGALRAGTPQFPRNYAKLKAAGRTFLTLPEIYCILIEIGIFAELRIRYSRRGPLLGPLHLR